MKPFNFKRAEILLGEKEGTRANLLQELRRLVASEKSLTVPQVIITRQLSNPSQSVAASFALLFELKMRCALLGRLFLPDVSTSRLDVA